MEQKGNQLRSSTQYCLVTDSVAWLCFVPVLKCIKINGEAMPIHYEIIGQTTVKSDTGSLRQEVSRKFTFGSYPSNIIHIP